MFKKIVFLIFLPTLSQAVHWGTLCIAMKDGENKKEWSIHKTKDSGYS